MLTILCVVVCLVNNCEMLNITGQNKQYKESKSNKLGNLYQGITEETGNTKQDEDSEKERLTGTVKNGIYYPNVPKETNKNLTTTKPLKTENNGTHILIQSPKVEAEKDTPKKTTYDFEVIPFENGTNTLKRIKESPANITPIDYKGEYDEISRNPKINTTSLPIWSTSSTTRSDGIMTLKNIYSIMSFVLFTIWIRL